MESELPNGIGERHDSPSSKTMTELRHNSAAKWSAMATLNAGIDEFQHSPDAPVLPGQVNRE
ncbi:MAG: hypothetical protein DRR11_20435 [Gammaproteobacteria bacterium]|nr:MAG: hypothetical protein DRR11_20435 [Gammaproteobacteria bacterium]RLA29872.1 MAG: hypothetical protein DRR15_15750 [Gammaproteobacteria bacterium]